MSLAAWLRTHGGHDVRIVDGFEGDGPDTLANLTRDWAADVVGITGLTAHAYDAMVAAHMVKEARPEALVLAGGIHFSAVPQDTLALCPSIDAIVLGEGEQTFAEVVGVPRSGWPDTPGLGWMEDGVYRQSAPREQIADLGQLAMPAFDLVNPDRYQMRPFRYSDRMMLEGSRGCPFSCSFCHTTQFWRRRWRPRPVEAILEDMSYVRTRMGRTAFHFADDSFATRRERMIDLCEGVLKRGWKVDMWAQCRVDDLYRDRDLFPLMKRAGFYGFLIGFESGETAHLERWNKGTTADKARELAPFLKEHFDSITGTFFIGDWESVEADFHAARAFASDLDVDIFIASNLTLFPPTIPIWKSYEDRGVEMVYDYDAIGNAKVVLPTRALSKEEVSRLQAQNMLGFYLNPGKALNAIKSGRHATRSFADFLLSGLQDTVRDQLRSRVPAGLRGRSAILRAQYKAAHLQRAREQGMPGMTRPWTELTAV